MPHTISSSPSSRGPYIIIAVGGIMMFVGFILIRRIVDIEV